MKKFILLMLLSGTVHAHGYYEHHHHYHEWSRYDNYSYKIEEERRREFRRMQREREYHERKFNECQYYLDTEQYRRYEFRCE